MHELSSRVHAVILQYLKQKDYGTALDIISCMIYRGFIIPTYYYSSIRTLLRLIVRDCLILAPSVQMAHQVSIFLHHYLRLLLDSDDFITISGLLNEFYDYSRLSIPEEDYINLSKSRLQSTIFLTRDFW